ncbi:MAG: dTDP-4-dehydrorhamnose 3,5-epimerase [Bacteroidales bacterium]|nr:dTDP-4-dehydrorhamnose 3,5-epimerase [Bacteroidales bacterium]
MEIIQTEIPGVLILKPRVFEDARGCFFESFNEREFEKAVPGVRFVQDNESHSSYGVVRGLHYQKGVHSQSKLVRVLEGRVLDIAVDIRVGSPTFGKHVAAELSGENKLQFFIPKGFAHGFSVLSEKAVFLYKCDSFYEPSAEGAIAWNDPALGIDWGIPADKVILSAKDANHPTLAQCAPGDLFKYEK